MALVTVTVAPGDDVESFDFDGRFDRIAGFRVDGVQVFLTDRRKGEKTKDEAIIGAADMLIGVLIGLRDAAAQRIRDEKAAYDATWAAELNGTRDTPLAQLAECEIADR